MWCVAWLESEGLPSLLPGTRLRPCESYVREGELPVRGTFLVADRAELVKLKLRGSRAQFASCCQFAYPFDYRGTSSKGSKEKDWGDSQKSRAYVSDISNPSGAIVISPSGSWRGKKARRGGELTFKARSSALGQTSVSGPTR